MENEVRGDRLRSIFRISGIAGLCFLGLGALISGVDQVILLVSLRPLSPPDWHVMFVYSGVLEILFGVATLFLALWFKRGEVTPPRLGLVIALYSIGFMRNPVRRPDWAMTFVLTALAIAAIVLYIRPSFPTRLAGSILGFSVVFFVFVLRTIEVPIFHPMLLMVTAYWIAILLGCMAAIYHALPDRSARITLLALCAAAMIYGVSRFSHAFLAILWHLSRGLEIILVRPTLLGSDIISAIFGFLALVWSTAGFIIYGRRKVNFAGKPRQV